jgi:hypothetical protein
MKHILRLVTYATRKRVRFDERPVRPIEPASWTVLEFDHEPQLSMLDEYRLIGIARYPDRVELRYERYP